MHLDAESTYVGFPVGQVSFLQLKISFLPGFKLSSQLSEVATLLIASLPSPLIHIYYIKTILTIAYSIALFQKE